MRLAPFLVISLGIHGLSLWIWRPPHAEVAENPRLVLNLTETRTPRIEEVAKPPRPAAPSKRASPHPPSQLASSRPATSSARPSPPAGESGERPAAKGSSYSASIPAEPSPPAGDVQAPRPLVNPRPRYPRLARRRGLEGEVLLEVEVGLSGHPLKVRVLRSSGHAVLDEAAREAVARWRFAPARRGGIPIPATARIPIRFRLEG